ncbi:MAG: ATP-binding protein [Phycisphaerae bacterium]|jgi:signal transduction histidine kinase
MFRSIKTKILVLQIGLVLSVAVSLGVVSYLITFSSLRASQQQNLRYLAANIGEEISVLIDSKGRLLEKIGTSETVTNYAKKQQENFLVGYFEKFMPEFDTLSYVDDKGMEELKVIDGRISTALSNVRNSIIFQRAVNNPNKTLNSYTAFCPELNGPCIEFGFMEKNFFDEFVGFLLGKVSVTVLAEKIRGFKEKSDFAILLDSSGTILACQDKDKILKKVVIEGAGSEHIVSGIKTMGSGSGRAVISGIDSYFAYSPVPGQHWSVVTIMPYQQFIAKLNALRNTVLLVGLTILIAGIALSLFLASDITQPIAELVKTTGLIATGDFSQRVNIDSTDEIGTLAQSFNGMAENLQKTTTSMVNLNREVIERKKAENAQQNLNEELKETVESLTIANRELADFAHVVAHDLKSPLRGIGSLAGIILADYRDRLDERGRQYLDMLVGRTERMSELISGIMTYSELGRVAAQQPIDLNEVVQEAIAEVAPPENIKIVQENDFPTIICDRTHMIQVFQNLLGNSVKFMDKPHGLVLLNCVEDDDFWKFSVADNGCGIESKYFEKIFRIFQTLIRRDEAESTGIGLSVVKRIIEKYDGKIWVESKPEKGSTFFFTLPKQKMEVKNEKFQTNSIS